MRRLLTLVAALLWFLPGCATMNAKVAENVKPLVAAEELDSTQLLDVAIVVFDSEQLTDKQIRELGLSEEIRRAEERFIPIHLKTTMQRTGYWGAVRVVPEPNKAHLQVHGTIVASDGEQLVVEIEAYDARNVRWLQKSYAEEIDLAEFSGIAPGKLDPFQDLYNTIANDLATLRGELAAEDLREIQEVAELRSAQEIAPQAFRDYVVRNEDDRFERVRLPAADDPMLNRVRAIQVRDAMLLDTINSYYESYYTDLWTPYSDWRKLYNEELRALRKVEKEAMARKLLGLASIVGGVLLSSNSNVSGSGLPGLMVIGGAAAVYSGFQKSEETKIHKDVIEELSVSFSSEAEPLTLDVVGETVRLTGSAEEQYRQWRNMLDEIYASETGFAVDPDDTKQQKTAHPAPGDTL